MRLATGAAGPAFGAAAAKGALEPGDRMRQPFLQGDFGLPAEKLPGARDIRPATLRIVRRQRLMNIRMSQRTDTMSAAIVTGPGTVRIERLPLPQPGRGQVRIRLEGCGVCASNLVPWAGPEWMRFPTEPGALGHGPARTSRMASG